MKLLLSLAIMALVGCKAHGQTENNVTEIGGIEDSFSSPYAKIIEIDTTISYWVGLYASSNWPDTNTIKQIAIEEYEDKIAPALAWWYVIVFFIGIVAASLIRYLSKHLLT